MLTTEPDGVPVAVLDWPEQGSPTPRITFSVDNGQMLIRINAAMQRLVLSTVKQPRQLATAA
jgi:hypothetical protein